MGHLEYEMDLDLHKAMADRGAYLEYDCFGQEHHHDIYNCRDPLDCERVAFVSELIRLGYVSQILLSHDIATKLELRSYGGWGYSHLSKHVEPMFLSAGVTPAQIHTMRVDNPQRVLPF
jgi:phosphotriesterase-related protein